MYGTTNREIDFRSCTVPEALSVSHFEREFISFQGVERLDNGGVRGPGKSRVRRVRDNSNPDGTGARSIEPERTNGAVHRSRVQCGQ